MMKAIRYMLLGSLLTLLVVALSALTAHDAGILLTVVERAENRTLTDTGTVGDSAGDILTFANSVYDTKNETQIGTDNGYCIRTVVGTAWECHWVLSLEEGQITVEGPLYDTGNSVFAITGGTGDYADARGEMNLLVHSGENTAYNFIYKILP